MAWHQYEDARSIEERGLAEIERRRKSGETFEALAAPSGSKKLVVSFWGKAWCRHLETYSDYEFRLPRGRSYLRKGNVYNLQVSPGLVTASVLGSSLYEVTIKIKELEPEVWTRIQRQCEGNVSSLLDLLGGRLGPGVMEMICDKECGLFPTPQEIRMSCSCPDWADMCKHVAAVMYGIGVTFDMDPSLFFKLRHVDPLELLVNGGRQILSDVSAAESGLEGEDLGALFGINLDCGGDPSLETHGTQDGLTATHLDEPQEAPSGDDGRDAPRT
jgi:uncharacterized Zn finger protein